MNGGIVETCKNSKAEGATDYYPDSWVDPAILVLGEKK